ncbi:DUF3747 domain-containing protein [Cyanobium sp. FGCU-52]|nr:DUF3747 domain-containing protein [Cyanobium sp. FGCU52]
MKRTYLALAGLSLAVSAAPALGPSLVRAAGLFQAQPVDASRFAVLAKPVGSGDWSLLVLEQLRSAPLCWQPRADGLVDPSLNRFDYTGICARYLDSNGYSLRVGDQDLGASHRLRVQQVGSTLQLQALAPDQGTVLVVGRAPVPLRDRDGFVALQLEPGWELQRRSYGSQTLNHLYFASATPLTDLQAMSTPAGLVAPPPPGAPPSLERALAGVSPSGRNVRQDRASSPPRAERMSRLDQALNATSGGRRQARQISSPPWSAPTTDPEAPPSTPAGRAVALQVIPFQE